MKLDLGGVIVELVPSAKDATTYAALVDGRRIPISRRFRSRRARTYDPHDFLNDWAQADAHYLPQLHHAVNAVPERIGDTLRFEFAETAGARTNYLGTIKLALRDGVLVVDTLLERQLLRLDLGGPVLELVQVDANRYAAEVDGVRVPIRLHRVQTDKDGTRTEDAEGMEVVLWEVPDLGDLTRDGSAFVFAIHRTYHEYWFKIGRVVVRWDGNVVHWDADVRLEGGM